MKTEEFADYTKSMWEKMLMIKTSYESILNDLNSLSHLEPEQEMMVRAFIKQKLQEAKDISKDCQNLYFESVKIQEDELNDQDIQK